MDPDTFRAERLSLPSLPNNAVLETLRITKNVSARCNQCGEPIVESELACEVRLRQAEEFYVLRFHHACYREWRTAQLP